MFSNVASNSGPRQEWSSDDLDNEPVILVSRNSSGGLKTVLEETPPTTTAVDEGSSIPPIACENAGDVFGYGMRCEAAMKQDFVCDRCYVLAPPRFRETPIDSPDEHDNKSVIFEEVDIKQRKNNKASEDVKTDLELSNRVGHVEAVDIESVEKERAESYAIIVLKGVKHPTSDKTAHLHSVTVQSPLIKEVLMRSFVELGCNYMDFDSRSVRLAAPFDPILRCWDKLQDVAEHDASKEVREHVKLLLDVVKPDLEEPLQAIKICRENHAIAYEFLWTIYKPGELMYVACDKTGFEADQLVRITESRYFFHKNRPRFEICAECVVWSGVEWLLDPITRVIDRFEGTCNILSFLEIPLQFHPDKVDIQKMMLERGRNYENLQSFHFKSYSGRIFVEDAVRECINERVVIDAGLMSHLNARTIDLPRTPLMTKGRSNHISSSGWPRPQPAFQCDSEYNETPHHKDLITPLTEDQLLICSPYVDAYLMKQKRWGRLQVDKIKDIEWNDTFEDLVLPNGDKSLILALVEEHIKLSAKCGASANSNDNSLVILIKGPPGVGKSLTAESVAEKLHIPFFTVKLDRFQFWRRENNDIDEFHNAWNAILLLEEPELFIEDRRSSQELLSAFLKKLDDYHGVLFITAKSSQVLDPALESRIDLTINIPTPAYPERCQIWSNCFARERQGKLTITENEMHLLADKELNGRQIKSVMKMARLLAARRGKEVRISHVLEILQLREL